MAFCKNCGAEVADGTAFCQACGTSMEANPANNSNTQQTTANTANNDVDNNKFMAVLAYFGILVLIPILAAKDSKFARYHSNQGLILCIFGIAYSVLSPFINRIPVLGVLLPIAVPIFIFVLCIMGIVNAAKGEEKELPLIGSLKILK